MATPRESSTPNPPRGTGGKGDAESTPNLFASFDDPNWDLPATPSSLQKQISGLFASDLWSPDQNVEDRLAELEARLASVETPAGVNQHKVELALRAIWDHTEELSSEVHSWSGEGRRLVDDQSGILRALEAIATHVARTEESSRDDRQLLLSQLANLEQQTQQRVLRGLEAVDSRMAHRQKVGQEQADALQEGQEALASRIIRGLESFAGATAEAQGALIAGLARLDEAGATAASDRKVLGDHLVKGLKAFADAMAERQEALEARLEETARQASERQEALFVRLEETARQGSEKQALEAARQASERQEALEGRLKESDLLAAKRQEALEARLEETARQATERHEALEGRLKESDLLAAENLAALTTRIVKGLEAFAEATAKGQEAFESKIAAQIEQSVQAGTEKTHESLEDRFATAETRIQTSLGELTSKVEDILEHDRREVVGQLKGIDAGVARALLLASKERESLNATVGMLMDSITQLRSELRERIDQSEAQMLRHLAASETRARQALADLGSALADESRQSHLDAQDRIEQGITEPLRGLSTILGNQLNEIYSGVQQTLATLEQAEVMLRRENLDSLIQYRLNAINAKHPAEQSRITEAETPVTQKSEE